MNFINNLSQLIYYHGFTAPTVSGLTQWITWFITLFASTGLGIILFTVILKVITLPLDYASRASMRKNSLKMEEMRPELEKLQKQYANDKQLYQTKMMELYKKNGYSAFGACLPTIVTLVLFIVILQSFNKYSNYLIGDILSITPNEICLLLIVLVVVIIFWSLFFNKFILSGLNESIAKSRKIKSDILKLMFILIIAVVVMITIKWVGILIINSLLILPAATSRNIARNVKQYTIFSIVFSLISCVVGLISSYYLETAAGATIVLVSAIFFVLSLFGLKHRDY